jgi:hypothetical protein
LKNFWNYLLERFAPANWLLFFIMYFAVHHYAAAHFLNNTPALRWLQLVDFLAVLSFFFKLRVMDEHKDYQNDLVNYPDRVLQSGKVTLKQLRYIAYIGTVFEAAWSAYLGTTTLLIYLVTLGYALLMWKEFFVGEWLKKRLVIYAFTHMLIMPLVIFWIASMGTSSNILILEISGIAAAAFFFGFAFEIARKIWSAEEERAEVDSYSKRLGMKGALFTVLFFLALGCAATYFPLAGINHLNYLFGILSLLAVFTGVVIYVAGKPVTRNIKLMQAMSSLFMLLTFVLLFIGVR